MAKFFKLGNEKVKVFFPLAKVEVQTYYCLEDGRVVLVFELSNEQAYVVGTEQAIEAVDSSGEFPSFPKRHDKIKVATDDVTANIMQKWEYVTDADRRDD